MLHEISLTTQTVCQALRMGRHTLRRWIEELPTYVAQPTRARSARRFGMADLVFFSAVLELESIYGLGLQAIARFDAGLQDVLRNGSLGARFLFLDVANASCEAVSEPQPPRAGILLDMEPVYRRVASAFAVPTPFPELPFAWPQEGKSA